MLKAVDDSIELSKRFENVLANIKQPVAFQESWRSSVGPGYDGAVNLNLAPGQIVKSTDPQGKIRMILIGTDLDTVVVYERYNTQKSQSFSLVYNANAALDFLLGGSYLSIAQFSMVVTDYEVNENIGVSLANLYNRIGRRKHNHNVHELVPVPKR